MAILTFRPRVLSLLNKRATHSHGQMSAPVVSPAVDAPTASPRSGWLAAIDAASRASVENVSSVASASAATAVNATRAVASATQAATGSAVAATLGAAGATRNAAAAAGRVTLDAAGALGRATSNVAGSAGRATAGAVGATLSVAGATGRLALDAAATSGRVTADAAAVVGRASAEAVAIPIALTRWVAAQPFDSTPYAGDTLQALQAAGFDGEPTLGRLWTKPSAAARVVRLPRGLRSGPGESLEAILSATVTAGVVRVSVAVPSTGFSWEAPIPAESPAVAVPGLSVSAFGWANLGLVVACALAPAAPPAADGLALVISASLGASVYGLGKSGVPLCDFAIPLDRARLFRGAAAAAAARASEEVGAVAAPVASSLAAAPLALPGGPKDSPEPAGATVHRPDSDARDAVPPLCVAAADGVPGTGMRAAAGGDVPAGSSGGGESGSRRSGSLAAAALPRPRL